MKDLPPSVIVSLTAPPPTFLDQTPLLATPCIASSAEVLDRVKMLLFFGQVSHPVIR
jgi:hypothetical protein